MPRECAEFLIRWAGGTFNIAPQARLIPRPETKDGRECRSGGQQAREFTIVVVQAVVRG